MVDASYSKYFQSKNGACNWVTKYSPEASRHARHQQYPQIFLAQSQPFAHQACHTASHLHSRSFPARRTAKQMRDQCGNQYQRRHACRPTTTRLMDLSHDKVIAGFRILSGIFIKEKNE